MRRDNLLCLRKRPFVPVTTDSRHARRVVPNLARGLVPTGLDQLWVADITYIRPLEELAYLAVLLGAFSRRVIGWALDKHLRASIATEAQAKAVTATAHKIAVQFYNAVRHGMEYVDPGASFYETRYHRRVVNNLHRRAKAFGFVLQPMEPTPGVVVVS